MRITKDILPSLRMLVILSVLTGIVYPLMVFAPSRLWFSSRANGSLVSDDTGAPSGSSLIGRQYKSSGYFQGRPSASDYGAMPSAASNLGPTSTVLKDQIQKRRLALMQWHSPRTNTAGVADEASVGSGVPADLLTASASGLDPHISYEAALFQVDRVLAERRMMEGERPALLGLIEKCTDKPGLLRKRSVNVLCANLALDKKYRTGGNRP